MSGRSRFSIVIPTRNRASTLRFALLTCLAQESSDYEVIVCDNNSHDNTADVVRGLESERVKYLHSSRSLAMSDNWELAVSHAQGEYVTVLGDDDGLLLNALVDAERVVSQTKTKAFRWDKVYYHWPDQSLLYDSNHLAFLLPVDSCTVDATATLAAVMRGGAAQYPLLPLIYNSFVHRELLDDLRRRAGRVFKTITPDVYSGMAFALMLSDYVSVGRPLSIEGVSSASTGAAQFGSRETQNPIFGEFQSFNIAAGLQWHPNVPEVPRSISAIVAESFEHAKDVLKPDTEIRPLNRQGLSAAIVNELRNGFMADADWTNAIERIDRFLAPEPNAQRWFRDYCASTQRDPVAERRRPVNGFTDGRFTLNAAEFGISDTHGVADFIEKLFGFCHRGLWVAPLPSPTALDRIQRFTKDLMPPLLWRTARRWVNTGNYRNQ